jgi:hypothetical protein
MVRTDRRHHHRLIAGDSEQVEAVKVLARAHQTMVWSRARQTNLLRSTLREFYPAALLAFDHLASGDALEVLRIAPGRRWVRACPAPRTPPLCAGVAASGGSRSAPSRSKRPCVPSNCTLLRWWRRPWARRWRPAWRSSPRWAPRSPGRPRSSPRGLSSTQHSPSFALTVARHLTCASGVVLFGPLGSAGHGHRTVRRPSAGALIGGNSSRRVSGAEGSSMVCDCVSDRAGDKVDRPGQLAAGGVVAGVVLGEHDGDQRGPYAEHAERLGGGLEGDTGAVMGGVAQGRPLRARAARGSSASPSPRDGIRTDGAACSRSPG